ncbi:MAG: hypothetical protein JWP82_1570 [Humibacillus sp.]|nr:hypothetical protein [Humibacillus sp.]
MSTEAPLVALTAATALHAGFQVTVSALVYPVLLGTGEDWSRRHDAHSRAIVPLVAVVYGALVAACAWVVAVGVGRGSPGVWVAVGGSVLTMAVTALGAAPLHGRLGRGHDAGAAHRLVRVDRLRLVTSLVALAGALAALVGR